MTKRKMISKSATKYILGFSASFLAVFLISQGIQNSPLIEEGPWWILLLIGFILLLITVVILKYKG